MIEGLVFIFGTIIGSFLNVCIYRMPKKEPVVKGRSHCVSCKKTIAWYDNIPLLSFIFLRGRCRYCKERISFRYFVVELLTALLYLLLFIYFGLSVKFAVFVLVVSALIILSFIDLDIQEIPDEITLPGIVIGIALCAIFPYIISQERHLDGLIRSILGMVVGGGLTYMMGLLGEGIFKKEAMGGGDVKLMAMLGAFLGWKLITLTFFLAPFSGSIVGIIGKIRNKEDVIPYGPHLSLASIVALIWGEKIIRLIIPY